MARRSDHSKEELKQMIFNSAKSLATEGGRAKLSMRRIASSVGYTAGTIYSFYNNLEDLILNINADTLDMLYSELNSATAGGGEESIRAIASTYLRFNTEHENLWSLLFEAREIQLPEWYEAKVEQIFKLVAEKIATVASCDANDQAKILWAALHGITTLEQSGKLSAANSRPASELVNDFVNVYIKGLK